VLVCFFKDSAEINKNDKDKIAFKTAYNRGKMNGFKSWWRVLPDFRV
jgi:hypothetical protein